MIDGTKTKQRNFKAPSPETGLLDRAGLCERYGWSLVTAHRMVKKGLPYFKIGRRPYFRISDVEVFLTRLPGQSLKGGAR